MAYLQPTRNAEEISDTDLAYAAGVIDSDGCVSVTRGRLQRGGFYTFPIYVNVTQKTSEMPLWFLATFGGKVRNKKNSKWGTILVWELFCQNAANFLERIIPYLKKKKLRAEIAVKLARMSQRRGGTGYRYGGKAVTLEEANERERLAIIIRSENQIGNARTAVRSTWGVN